MLPSPSTLPGLPQPQQALSLLNSHNGAFSLSCPLIASPLCFRCTCHIFTTRHGTLWPEDTEPHMFLETSRNTSVLFIYYSQHASCLAKTNTVHEDLRHLLPKILIVHGRINTYVSTKILTGHFCVLSISNIPLQSGNSHSSFMYFITVTKEPCPYLKC